MAKQKDINNSKSVTDYVQQLDARTAATAQAIRDIILSVSENIGEQIKWNAPSFFYTGDMAAFDAKEYKRDIIVYNLRKKEYILLIMPTGDKVKDSRGLLEGEYTDGRRMIKITDASDAMAKAGALKQVIQDWIKLIDK